MKTVKNLRRVIHENIWMYVIVKILSAHYAVKISYCKIFINAVYKTILCTYVYAAADSYLVIT